MKLRIEKLIYGGDGLARLPADSEGRSKAVFMPYVVPEELVEATFVEEKPGFARALVQEILEPSTQRVQPGCRYFGVCGGCHYQHIGYDQQLAAKETILRETLARIAKVQLDDIRVHPSPPWNYRNRTRLRVRQADAGIPFALGYYKLASHELLAVAECPISSKLINRAISAVTVLGDQKQIPPAVREVEFFVNHDDSQLLLELIVDSTASDKKFQALWNSLRNSLPALAGMAISSTPSELSPETVAAPELASTRDSSISATFGSIALEYRTKADSYRVSAGAFFQTNLFLVNNLVEMTVGKSAGELAWDLYAGVGLFSLPLSRSFNRVMAVESSPISATDLRHNAPPQVRTQAVTVDRFLQTKQKHVPDLILLDPPRSGLGKRVAQAVASVAPREITYISCDPSTLARDIGAFLTSGYKIQETHLIDLFPQTFHMETVLKLRR